MENILVKKVQYKYPMIFFLVLMITFDSDDDNWL